MNRSSAHLFKKHSLVTIPKNAPIWSLANGTPLVNVKLKLTLSEEKLFLLINKAISINNLSMIARVAGGWVRDKILGIPSDDIDINLDKMTGIEFAKKLRDIAEKPEMTHFGCIKSNPEKSKNLETATFSIFGINVDINNLRSETYDNISRVPIIKMGTPLEDATRRDFTLNSLFYNINENLIEDFTNHGVADLLRWTLKTPLDPLQTFLDDPLRTIRACRFSSRFGFFVDPPILACAALNPNVKRALETKVSCERIGIEIAKIFQNSPFSNLALSHLLKMGLFSSVFRLPADSTKTLSFSPKMAIFSKNGDIFPEIALSCVKTIDGLLANETGRLFSDRLKWRLAALLLPVAPFYYRPVRSKTEKHFGFFVLSKINFPNNLIAAVVNTLTLSHSLINIMAEWEKVENINIPTERITVQIGDWIGEAGENWGSVSCFVGEILGHDTNCDEKMVKKWIGFFPYLADTVRRLNLAKCYEWKKNNFFNAKDFEKILGIPPGVVYKEIKDEMFKWRLMNLGKGRDECLQWLVAKYKSN